MHNHRFGRFLKREICLAFGKGEGRRDWNPVSRFVNDNVVLERGLEFCHTGTRGLKQLQLTVTQTDEEGRFSHVVISENRNSRVPCNRVSPANGRAKTHKIVKLEQKDSILTLADCLCSNPPRQIAGGV
mmetsp:Transcript_25472/g.70147  ORF Transcript_25472/g.70147 Transcript_25472/m.70147 type:complete len:129 (-) Transcript_25472:112-498(-)